MTGQICALSAVPHAKERVQYEADISLAGNARSGSAAGRVLWNTPDHGELVAAARPQ
jgi:hypothetical protein